MAKNKAQQALEFVREEAKHSPSDTDLHNAFFGNGGKFGQLFRTRQVREAFAKTPEYEETVRTRASRQVEKSSRVHSPVHYRWRRLSAGRNAE